MIPGRVLNVLLAVNARTSSKFQIQNKISGSHNQLVITPSKVTLATFWWTSDQLIKKARTRVARKIIRPRCRLPSKNCPTPGNIKEENIIVMGLIVEWVVSEVAMNDSQ
jgi:hypothetical protein